MKKEPTATVKEEPNEEIVTKDTLVKTSRDLPRDLPGKLDAEKWVITKEDAESLLAEYDSESEVPSISRHFVVTFEELWMYPPTEFDDVTVHLSGVKQGTDPGDVVHEILVVVMLDYFYNSKIYLISLTDENRPYGGPNRYYGLGEDVSAVFSKNLWPHIEI